LTINRRMTAAALSSPQHWSPVQAHPEYGNRATGLLAMEIASQVAAHLTLFCRGYRVMTVWAIRPITERPQVTLQDWAAFEVPLNGPGEQWTRHLVGWACEDGQGQVCSAVQQFDPATGRCVTSSGRVYRVRGNPGLRQDAEYVWQRWMKIANVQQQRDVTNEVFNAILAAQGKTDLQAE
jgi:hypothetical protein